MRTPQPLRWTLASPADIAYDRCGQFQGRLKLDLFAFVTVSREKVTIQSP